MKRYIEGIERDQGTLFPEHLEDWVGEDNAVRVIDAFVDELDLHRLGFDRAEPEATGRLGYHPVVLSKLYVYGYLNRMQSSRHLEREAERDVKVMWLTGRLAPDHKTIADFRKDNGPAIRKVCSQFVEFCGRIGLLATASVESYLHQLDMADRQEPADVLAMKVTGPGEKITKLREEMQHLQALEARRLAALGGLISLTNPDFRLAATRQRG